MTRDDARLFMRKLWRETVEGSFAEEAFEIAIKALEQPERKKGRWIEVTDHEIPIVCKCSVCEWRTKDYDWFNYCPNCGAKMEVEHAEV